MENVSKVPESCCFWLAEGESIETPARGCEVFKYVPTLLESMDALWDKYKNFDHYKWNEGATKEKVYDLYVEMYFCFRRLNFVDLQIIWYLHNGVVSSVSAVLKSLQRAFDSRCSALEVLGLKRENLLTVCKCVEEEP